MRGKFRDGQLTPKLAQSKILFMAHPDSTFCAKQGSAESIASGTIIASIGRLIKRIKNDE